jgi:hypothetical protein
MTSSKRPGVFRWLGYAFGAGLPAEYDEWVLHDTTAPTWVLRHLARTLVQLALVIAAVLIFVPGPFWIRAVMVAGGTFMALLFAAAYMTETVEHRLVKAGYPAGTGEATRERRSTEARTAAVARRQARLVARREAQAHKHA